MFCNQHACLKNKCIYKTGWGLFVFAEEMTTKMTSGLGQLSKRHYRKTVLITHGKTYFCTGSALQCRQNSIQAAQTTLLSIHYHLLLNSTNIIHPRKPLHVCVCECKGVWCSVSVCVCVCVCVYAEGGGGICLKCLYVFVWIAEVEMMVLP